MKTQLDDNNEKLVVGDDFDVERTVENIPEGDSLAEAWLTIKRNTWDTDEEAIIQKHITPTISVDGHITEPGSNLIPGAMIFQLVAADTVLLRAEIQYAYDIQLKSANGKIFTREVGTVIPEGQVTLDT